MADTLLDIANGPVGCKVFSDGEQIKDTMNIKSFYVSKAINKVASAIVELNDGGTGESNPFVASDSQKFDPGKEIEIQIGYGSTSETVFKGVVVRHGYRMTRSGDSVIKIECKDEAVKLTLGRKNALFNEKTDSDIITEILSDYSGISSSVDSTSYANPELIQNYTTDWDFVVQRAELNGLALFNSDNELTIKPPEIGSPVLEVGPGLGLLDVNTFIDARNQFSKITTTSWDRENQEIVSEDSASAPDNPGGNIRLSDLSDVIGLSQYNLQTTSSIPSEVLSQWAAAKHLKASLSKIQGKITIEGYPSLKLGDVIALDGVSDQFNGSLFVGGFEHVFEDSDFTTTIEVGMNPNFFSEEKIDIPASGASGMLSPMKGLHIGVVEQIHEDDNGEFRIKVKLPTLQVDNLSVWARQANFYATANAGMFFYPEINDEVIIGFLNEDPQSPIVLGSLYNKSVSTPSFQPEETNYTKAIVTKEQLKVLFDEENKAITIVTPGEQSVVIDDTAKVITVTDMNDNIMEMTADGVKITSAGNIVFDAKGDIELTAGGNIAMAATGDMTGEGMNVELSGKTAFTAKGTTCEVNGSAQTVVKGGLVSIN